MANLRKLGVVHLRKQWILRTAEEDSERENGNVVRFEKKKHTLRATHISGSALRAGNRAGSDVDDHTKAASGDPS